MKTPRPNPRDLHSNHLRSDDTSTRPAVLRKGREFTLAGPRHSGGSRIGRTDGDSIIDRGICIGC